MPVREFQYRPGRWAMLTLDATTTQADVDGLFSSIDTTGWAVPPTWDAAAQTLTWRILDPYTMLEQHPAGTVVAVERPYYRGQPTPVVQPNIAVYPAGTWSDSDVTYLV